MRSYFLPRMVVKIQVIIDFDIFYLPLLDLANLHFFRSKKLCDNLISNLKDNTVFFITHRLATIKNSDQIIVMHNGKLDEMGSYKQLMSNKGRYFALESQQGNIG